MFSCTRAHTQMHTCAHAHTHTLWACVPHKRYAEDLTLSASECEFIYLFIFYILKLFIEV